LNADFFSSTALGTLYSSTVWIQKRYVCPLWRTDKKWRDPEQIQRSENSLPVQSVSATPVAVYRLPDPAQVLTSHNAQL
jgi:hypothetical protein